MKVTIKNIWKSLSRVNGNSLAEFATVSALMATLAATAAPKLSEVSEGTKAQKTMNEIDKLLTQAKNFYQDAADKEGRGRFPGQDKYNLPVGGHADNQAVLDDILNVTNASGQITDPADFDYYAAEDGYEWVSIFGVSNFDYPKPVEANLRWDDVDEVAPCNVCPDSITAGRFEWLRLFGNEPLGSPYQDGHFVYQVVAGSGAGSKSVSPILYLADIEDPSRFHVILQP